MTENHSFGCVEDQIAMGLHDMSKAQVYQKPEEMNEEELFCKLFPEYAVNGKPLSPYFDLFGSGCEQAENRIEKLEESLGKMQKSTFDMIDKKNNRITELEKENAELKCECRRCVYTDSPCILSDYEKDRNGICDHFRDVFDEVVELKDEQKELLKDTAIYDSMLTKAKTLLQKVADVCGYPNYDIPVELYSDIADFIKDSEVEK